jgi:MFS family permease
MRIITRTVWILSIVSLFADIASEMLYPVIPVYLTEIGFTVFWIGLLEGLANFTAGISKGYFGKWSDEKGVRLPFVRLGYFLSAISKPMLAVFTLKLWIFFARALDRLGKGVRTAPRDALLSQEATRQTKARVFGFHRALDTTGAMLGPVLAWVYLYFYPGRYAGIFYLAFIPGLISVLLISVLREKMHPVSTLSKGNFFSFFNYWKIATPEYKKLVPGLLLFALFNSSDIFLLLVTREVTGSDMTTIAAYVFYNFVYAGASYPLGSLADRLGMKTVFIAGLVLFTVVYGGFAFHPSTVVIFILFFIYGLYAAATEGIASAWITNLAHETNTATAVGFYTSCQSICALLASVIAGLIWSQAGSQVLFFSTAVCIVLVIIYFLFLPKHR